MVFNKTKNIKTLYSHSSFHDNANYPVFEFDMIELFLVLFGSDLLEVYPLMRICMFFGNIVLFHLYQQSRALLYLRS